MSGTSPATAIKHDSNKLRMDLIPPEAELALAEILTYGANKYADRNWEKGFEGGPQANWDRIYGALRRHLLMYLLGERLDQESGKPHLWHALCCMAFLVTYEVRGMLPELPGVVDKACTCNDCYPPESRVPAPEDKLPLTIDGNITDLRFRVPGPKDKLTLTITAEQAGMGHGPWWENPTLQDDVYGTTLRDDL